MAFSAVIQADLTANNAQFSRTLANTSTQVSALETQMRRAAGIPLPGEGRSAQEAARSIDEIMRAQERLAASRAQRAYEEADTLGRIRILSEELRELGLRRAAAEEGTVEKLNLQIAAETKLAQLKTLRVRAQSERVAVDSAAAAAQAGSQRLAWQTASSVASAQAGWRAQAAQEESDIMAQIRARESSSEPTPEPRGLRQRFVDWRKGALKSLSEVGATAKGLGVTALVAGFRAVLNNAQAVRDQAYAIGAALDPAVERTAALADTFDRAKQGAMNIAATMLSWVQKGVDFAVAGVMSALGGDSFKENLAAIDEGNEAEARQKRIAATAKATAKAKEDEARAARALAEAEEAVAEARIKAAKDAADTEGKIAISALEVTDAQETLAAAKEGTVEHAKAELDLMEKQSELADLQRQREEEITKEKEKQIEAEAQLAKQREEAAAQLAQALAQQQAALLAVRQAQQAYANALADQSAASLSEITEGGRGTNEDKRRAAEVARLREQARNARDAGSAVLVGGQVTSVADQLSSRANQIQSGISALNTSERDPLAAVTAQLVTANNALAQIRESLTLMEVA